MLRDPLLVADGRLCIPPTNSEHAHGHARRRGAPRSACLRPSHRRARADALDAPQLAFLYKLVDGVAEGSFGTHVASLAGVPSEVVERAKVISADFATKFKKKIEGKTRSALPLPVQADFAYLAKLVNGLSLPDDAARHREVLNTIRQTVAKVVAT